MKKRPFLSFVLIVLVVGGVGLTWYNISKGPDRVLARAQEAIESGEPAQAITLLEELLQTRPNFYQAYMLIGQARISMQDFDGAREAAEKITDLRPNDTIGPIFSASIDRVEVSNTLGKPAVMIEESSVAQAITLLENGLKKLEESEGRENTEPGHLETERGLLWRAKSRAFELRAALKRQASRQAATVGEAEEAKSLQADAQAATKDMAAARTEAIKYLKLAHQEGDGQSQPALAMLDVALAMGIFEPVADLVKEVQNSTEVKHPALYVMAAQLIGRQDRYGFLRSPDARTAEALEIAEAGIKQFPDSIDLQVTAGQLELDRGNIQEALRYINDALTRSPQHPGAMTQRGRALLLSGQYGEARGLLQQFRAGGKADLQRSLYLAQSLMRSGEGETAKKMLLDVLELVPEDIDARLVLTHQLSDSGDFEEADRLLEEGIQAVPTSEELVAARVELALRRGRPGDIGNILKQAFAGLPETDSPTESLIGLTLIVGAQEAVRGELSSLAESSEAGRVGSLALAGVLLADEKLDEARSQLEGLKPAEHGQPGVLFAKARILAKAGDGEGAADALEEAVEAGPDVDLFRHAAAILYGSMGWHGTALMACEELLIQRMNHPAAQLTAAKQALFANKASRFAEHMSNYEQFNGNPPEEPLREALIALRNGTPAQCISLCSGIDSLDSLWLSALASEQLGNPKEARGKYLAALEMDPKRPELFQLYAKTFHDADEREAGQKTFQEMAAKYPINAKLGEALLSLFVQDWASAAKLIEEILDFKGKGLPRRTEFAMQLGLGTCWAGLGQSDKLSTLATELVEGENTRFAESIEAADFLTRINASDSALQVLDKAEQKLSKKHPLAWQRKQITDRYARLGQVERAISIYDRLIEASPLVAAFHTAKINLLRQAGRTEEAWQAVNRALQVHPTEVGFHIAQARMLSENHRFKEAIQKYRSFRSMNDFARETADVGLRAFLEQIGLHEEVLDLLKEQSQSGEGEPEARKLARVKALVELNRLDEAVAACDEITHASPAYAEGRMLIARGYAVEEDTERALTILKALAEGDPSFPAASQEIIRVLHRADRHEAIIAAVDEQLGKLPPGAPERTTWLSTKGQAALYLNRLDVARKVWEEMVQIVPDNPVLATQLAALLYAEGNLEEAKQSLEEETTKNHVGDYLRVLISLSAEDEVEAKATLQGIAVEQINPTSRQCGAMLSISANALADLAVDHWQVPSSASKLLEAAAEWATEPTRRRLVRDAATCLLLSDVQLPQAGLEYGKRVIAEAADIPLGYWVITSAYDMIGDSDAALSMVQTLVEEFPDLVDARDSLVLRLIDADRLDDADKALEAWTEAGGQPEASFAWSQGSYLSARGQREESIAAFEKCLATDPSFLPAKAKLVEVLIDKPIPDDETHQRVIELARELAQSDRQNVTYRMMLGWALALNQEFDEATVYLNSALTGMPRSAKVHYRLGWTYEKQGLTGMAKIHYRQAVSYGLEDEAEAMAAGQALDALSNPSTTQPSTAPASAPSAGAGG